MQDLLSAECQKLGGKGGRAGSRVFDLLDVVTQWVVGPQSSQGQVTVTGNGGQQIVKIVCYPAGQQSDCLHFLRLKKLFLELFAFGYIRDNASESNYFAIRIANLKTSGTNPTVFTIRSRNAIFD